MQSIRLCVEIGPLGSRLDGGTTAQLKGGPTRTWQYTVVHIPSSCVQRLSICACVSVALSIAGVSDTKRASEHNCKRDARVGAACEKSCRLCLGGVQRWEGCADNRSSDFNVRFAHARVLPYDHSHVHDLNNATRLARLKYAARWDAWTPGTLENTISSVRRVDKGVGRSFQRLTLSQTFEGFQNRFAATSPPTLIAVSDMNRSPEHKRNCVHRLRG